MYKFFYMSKNYTIIINNYFTNMGSVYTFFWDTLYIAINAILKDLK